MSSYSILVVDDEPDNFDTIEALLPSETYQLHYANCGKDAIAGLDKFNPDAILLDVMMPDLDGIEVCQRIRLMSKWYAVPIIMVTALSSKEDLARCLSVGADDFITKPVGSLELLARLNSMLRIKRQHDRIKSFSKLQRNNINVLTNDLYEIRTDLSVGFPNEFNSPLIAISDNIDYLKRNIGHLSTAETMQLLESSDRSTLQLHTLTQKFWFYLKLVVDTPTPAARDLAQPRSIVTQVLATKFAGVALPSHLSCEIADISLAVDADLAEWLLTELLEYLFDRSTATSQLKIHGGIEENGFCLVLSSRPANSDLIDNPYDSKPVHFNVVPDRDPELPIGLKIAKKIVDIYDGVFLTSGVGGGSTATTARQDISIYLNLPLASAPLPASATPARSSQN